MRKFALTAVIIVVAACQRTHEAHAPANAMAVAPPTASKVAASAVSPVAEDPFATEYDSITTQIAGYSGDPKVLDAARARLVAILEKDRNYAPAYLGLARIERARGYHSDRRYEPAALTRASKFVQHALKLDPQLHEAHIVSAMLSIFSGDFDLARTSLARADEILPGSHLGKLVHAELAMVEDDLPSAVRISKEVLASRPDASIAIQAWENLAKAYRREGHLDQADAAYREVITLNPQNAWAHGNYAGFLLYRGDLDGAIREGERAVALVPYGMAMQTLGQALVMKARAQWDSGDFAGAGATIERVATRGGLDAATEAGLGSFYEAAGIRSGDGAMRARALEWYRKAAQHEPDNQEYARAVARIEQTR